MNKKKFLLITAIFVLSGCSNGFNQDPLRNKVDAIGKGTPKETKPPGPPIDTEPMVIDALDTFSFHAEKAEQFAISARVMRKDFENARIIVENISDFPGASFDEVSGKFIWTPKVEFLGYDLVKTLPLKAVAVAESKNKTTKTQIIRQKAITVQVSRKPVEPTIIEVKARESYLREKDSVYFYITIRDFESVKSGLPTVHILPYAGQGKNLGSYITTIDYQVDQADPTKITARVGVDLTDDDFTQSMTHGGVNFQVVNGLRAVSNKETFTIPVYTRLNRAVHTGSNIIEFEAGKETRYDFMIYDPKLEGVITLEGIRGLPQNANADCQKKSREQYLLACYIKWSPQFRRNDDVVVDFKVLNKNAYSRDQDEIRTSLSLRLRKTK